MKTLNIVVTENCELCDKGIKKINLLKYFFNIEETVSYKHILAKETTAHIV